MLAKFKKGLKFIKKNGILMTLRAVYVKLRMKFGSSSVLVSIVMPVYNVENYLEQAMDSLLNQTMKKFEIIAVDDGSTDQSLEILERYAKKDSRVHVLTQKNQYAGVARNAGLAKAVGEYVVFLDSDDFFDKNLLKATYYKAKLYKADIALYASKFYNNVTEKYSKKQLLHMSMVPKKQPFSHKDCSEKLFQLTSPCPWTKMFNRRFIQESGLQFQALRNSNDIYFVNTALAMAEKIVTVDKTLVYYRVGMSTNLQATKQHAPLCFLESHSSWYDKLNELGLFEELKQSYVNRALAGCVNAVNTTSDFNGKRAIFEALKNGGFEELKVLGYEQSYYYDKGHYRDMFLIMNGSFEEYIEKKYGQR